MRVRSIPIHERLYTETHDLGYLGPCDVLLKKNALIPWLILVPDTAETELLFLNSDYRDKVLAEAATVAVFVRSYFESPKINFATIGNIVSQLHLHVVGRDPNDACWPEPVWGKLTQSTSYSGAEIDAIRASLVQRFALQTRA